MAVDGDPLDQLRAFQAARAAAPPDACDVIGRFGQRQLTNAVSRAAPLPVLMDKASPWLGALACDTQLWRDPAFCLAPLVAAPQPPPEIKPFDLSALQAAFTFRPSVVELTEVRRCVRKATKRRVLGLRCVSRCAALRPRSDPAFCCACVALRGLTHALCGCQAEKGAPLEPPPPPPPPVPTAAELEAAEQERLRKEQRRKEKKEKKREREGDATGATGGTSGGDASEGDKRTPIKKEVVPPAKVARKEAPQQERKPKAKEPKAERERDRDRDRDGERDRDRERPRERDRDRERDRERERKPAVKKERARSPAYVQPGQVVPLAGCVPKGYAVEPVAPELSSALIGRRVAMKGVGNRGESWCWGVVKQFYKPPTEEGWNVEVAWGGGQRELRDCRLHPDFYSTDPAEHPDMTEAWVLLEKI